MRSHVLATVCISYRSSTFVTMFRLNNAPTTCREAQMQLKKLRLAFSLFSCLIDNFLKGTEAGVDHKYHHEGKIIKA